MWSRIIVSTIDFYCSTDICCLQETKTKKNKKGVYTLILKDCLISLGSDVAHCGLGFIIFQGSQNLQIFQKKWSNSYDTIVSKILKNKQSNPKS